MNWRGIALWGLAGTAVLTTAMSASQALGLTRLDIPLILGTLFTPRRERARAIGFALHFLNGWLFAFVYAAIFESRRRATWWLGAIVGVAHAAFLLSPLMTLLPALHPRMASEQSGPSGQRRLEPPGALGFNYGRQTPLTVLAAHVLYGALLGACYRLARR